MSAHLDEIRSAIEALHHLADAPLTDDALRDCYAAAARIQRAVTSEKIDREANALRVSTGSACGYCRGTGITGH